MLRRIWLEVKDILFPVFCSECGREGEWWCANCRKKVNISLRKYEALAPLDGVEALFVYDENQTIGKLIRDFKYAFARDIAVSWRDIARLAAPELARAWAERGEYALLPIPLHPRRERERGYNQARVWCELVSAALGDAGVSAPIAGGLRRGRYTVQQARLSKDERAKNVAAAFVWTEKNPPPKNIILIDDVYTTGATAGECAAVLRAHGAQRVYAFTLAHG